MLHLSSEDVTAFSIVTQPVLKNDKCNQKRDYSPKLSVTHRYNFELFKEDFKENT